MEMEAWLSEWEMKKKRRGRVFMLIGCMCSTTSVERIPAI